MINSLHAQHPWAGCGILKQRGRGSQRHQGLNKASTSGHGHHGQRCRHCRASRNSASSSDTANICGDPPAAPAARPLPAAAPSPHEHHCIAALQPQRMCVVQAAGCMPFISAWHAMLFQALLSVHVASVAVHLQYSLVESRTGSNKGMMQLGNRCTICGRRAKV